MNSKKNNKKHIINIITLGCSKNLVDSEVLKRQLEADNFEVVHNSDRTDAKTVIINTCGFINDAKEESVNSILGFVHAKQNKIIDNLYVMGCLAERYKEEMKKEIPEVDGFFGVNQLKDILKITGSKYRKELVGERSLTTPGHFAYLKISEGCDRKCSFCAIPLIRGKHVSKTIEEVVDEATKLAEAGVKEIILIAQDLSYYGIDIYKKQMLPELLIKLSDIKKIKWIRLHYLYPSNFPLEILDIINSRENICKYIDIALQHISDPMLKGMKRGISKKQTYELIERIKTKVPDLAIRTSLMVGFPNESDKDFEELKQFVSTVKFDRLGVFRYSAEENTFAYKEFKDNIPEETKQARMDEIMELQQEIAYEKNLNLKGSIHKVLIDSAEGDFYIGRTQFDSPEIDNEVLIEKKGTKLRKGSFYNIRVTHSEGYDIYGELEK